MTAIILSFLSQFWGYIAAGVGLVVAYFAVKARGASQARQEDAAVTAKLEQKAQQVRQEVANDVARKDDDAVAAELASDWVRRK